MSTSYKKASGFRGKLNRDATSLINGKSTVDIGELTGIPIKRKQLELVFPDVPLSSVQKEVLDKFIIDNANKFDVVITIVK